MILLIFIKTLKNTTQIKNVKYLKKKYKKVTAKPYYFLVIDATLVSDSPSRFRKNLLERT